MSETECTQPNRRRWLGVIGAVLGLAGLSATPFKVLTTS